MKKNLVIMLMMVLCAGFASAQTVNTVRGFVPAGSTGAGDNATYVVLGQPFSMMSDLNNTNEVMVGLAQMQLITDTTMTVVGYRDGYHDHGIDLTPQELLERLEDISACSEGNPAEGYQGFLNFQKPNLAHNNDNYEYYYDSLFVVKVYICPDSTSDRSGNKYEVIALNNKCWINSNLRTTLDCDGNSVEGMMYTSELNEVTEATLPTYGLLYTMAAAMGTATTADGTAASVSCDETTGYLQGICPCGWHLPTVAEMEPLFVLPAENLRVDGNWIVDGNNNLSGFSAEPAGFYNATFDRFEGLLTETDYWMVNCDSLENPVQDVFQLIYSCNTPLKPKHSTDDALSVRCVYDIIYAFDNCEPNPEPLPDPETDCPTFGTLVPTEDLLGFTCQVNGEIDQVKLEYSGVLNFTDNSTGVPDVVTDPFEGSVNLTVANGAVSWHYDIISDVQPDNVTALSVVLSLEQGDCVDTVKGKLRTPPTTDCPTITINPAGFEKVEGKITPYSPNDHYTIVITGTYQGVFQNEPTSGDLVDEEVVDINDDGTFTWYPNYNQYDIDEFTVLTGQFTITGPVDGCSQTLDFTTAQDCNLSVGPLSFVDGVAQVEITNFDPDYFEDIQIEYNGDQSYHPTSDDFETVPGSNITTLSHQLPSGANSVVARFELKHEYYACGEDDEYYIFRNLCPTVSEFDVTADGVSVHVNNYDPDEIELDYWEYQIIYTGNNQDQWIPDEDVQPQVNNGVATFTSSIPSLPTMDNVQAIRVYVRFIFSSSECYPQGDDAYDISTTVYSQQQ